MMCRSLEDLNRVFGETMAKEEMEELKELDYDYKIIKAGLIYLKQMQRMNTRYVELLESRERTKK